MLTLQFRRLVHRLLDNTLLKIVAKDVQSIKIDLQKENV